MKTRARANRQRDSELRAHRLPALDAARVGALPRRVVSPGASAAAAAATAAAETQSRAFAVCCNTNNFLFICCSLLKKTKQKKQPRKMIHLTEPWRFKHKIKSRVD